MLEMYALQRRVAELCGDPMVAATTIPGNPVSKARPRVVGKRVYTPSAAEEDALAWQLKGLHKFGKASVVVGTSFFMPKETARNDGDNLHKLVLDALEKAGIYDNDRQVKVGLYSVGVDRDNPRTVIVIGELRSG